MRKITTGQSRFAPRLRLAAALVSPAWALISRFAANWVADTTIGKVLTGLIKISKYYTDDCCCVPSKLAAVIAMELQ